MVGERTTRRACGRVVVTVALVVAGWPGSALAATFTVISTSDTNDASPGNGVCANSSGNCSLRAAIQEANALAGDDTVTFGAVLSFAVGDPLLVTTTITVDGGTGAKQVLDGGGVGQVFELTYLGNLTLVNLELRNGAAPADGYGGVIDVGAGVLNLQYCSVHGGFAQYGGGIYASSGNISASFSSISSNQATSRGGGIHVQGTGGIYLWNSLVSNNISQGYAGGIWFQAVDWDGSAMTVISSVITANQADAAAGNGGGIYADDVEVTIQLSSVDDNSAYRGGGLYVTGHGSLLMLSSAVNRNSANDGGGLHYATDSGTVDDLFVTNTTFAGNHADNNGGGVYFSRGNEGHLSNCTVTGNHADADDDGAGDGGGVYALNAGLVIRNSLIAGNSDDSSGLFDFFAPDCAVRSSVTIVSDGYNLIGYTNDWCDLTGDTAHDLTSSTLPGLDPRLGALATYGCPTENVPLLAGSPAIDAGNPAGCVDHAGVTVSEDQCGDSRPHGSACDIGALESSITAPIFLNGFEAGSFSGWSSVTP